MKQSKFPKGWDKEKVRRVLASYEEQTEEEAVAEDEAVFDPSEAAMNVTHELLPKISELVAKRQS